MDEATFWMQVDKSGDCWIWQGGKKQGGYGSCRWDGATVGAHRVAWVICNGPIPDGMHVLHNCPSGDNPSCVNPAHLWLGTNLDNVRDRDKKGRRRPPHGTACGQAKLDERAVQEIRLACLCEGESASALARRYGVGQSAVSRIVRGKTWQNVPFPPGVVALARLPLPTKLTEEQVREIRSCPKYNGMVNDLARRYSVCPGTIGEIRGRRQQRDVL